MSSNKKHSIADCLADLGISDAALFQSDDIHSMDDEFKAIRKIYMQKVLREHPDKGGDANQFRTTQTAFEVLRELYQRGNVKTGTFASYLVSKQQQQRSNRRRRRGRGIDGDVDEEQQTAEDWDDIFAGFGSSEVPSYDYFAQAAEEELPLYKIELAKSGRSQCVKCKANEGKPATPATAVPDEEVSSAMAAVAKNGRRRRRTKQATTTAVSIHHAAAATMTSTVAPKYISKGDLRVGSLDDESGSYGRWHHLACWRVPNKVWQGLTDPENADSVWRDLLHMDQVLLAGLSVLRENEDHQSSFVQHVMDRNHWARKYTRKNKPAAATKKRSAAMAEEDETEAVHVGKGNKKPSKAKRRSSADDDDAKKMADGKNDDPDNDEAKRAETSSDEDEENQIQTTSDALVTIQERFVIPRPGINGAMDDDYLDGKRFVLTGIFPEIGGGKGLSLGKDKVKAMIESFGGAVTGSVSGKTDYLVVGKEPGASKVGQARGRSLPMLDLRTVRQLLMGEISFEHAETMELPKIQSFSAGYRNNRMIAN